MFPGRFLLAASPLPGISFSALLSCVDRFSYPAPSFLSAPICTSFFACAKFFHRCVPESASGSVSTVVGFLFDLIFFPAPQFYSARFLVRASICSLFRRRSPVVGSSRPRFFSCLSCSPRYLQLSSPGFGPHAALLGLPLGLARQSRLSFDPSDLVKVHVVGSRFCS
jgi:hypothetical protein